MIQSRRLTALFYAIVVVFIAGNPLDMLFKRKGLSAMNYPKIGDINAVKALFPSSVIGVEVRLKEVMAEAQRELDVIIAVPHNERTYDNTVRAYDKIVAYCLTKILPLQTLEMVSPVEELRNASRQAILDFERFSIEAFESKPVYEAFKAYHDRNAKSEDLTEAERYFLEKMMEDFIRAGLVLPPEPYAKAQVLKKELAELGIQFESNISADQRSVEVSCDELAGLRDDFIAGLKKTPDGKCILGTDYPTYSEVMDHCMVPSTRKALYLAFQNRAYPKNIAVLEQIIAKRDTLASILGFSSYAHVNIDDQMARKPETANDFIKDLMRKAEKKYHQEHALLKKNLPADVELTPEGLLQPWDVSYVHESYKKKHFDIDERVIAQYFPLEHTLKELFAVYQDFFGLTFVERKLDGVWHDEVSLIEIYNKDDNQFRGYIFLDLYPRPHKYTHACHAGIAHSLRYQEKDGQEIDRPSVGVIIANFTKPTAEKPSLLKHDEVTCFFHEFGHAMHNVLGQTEIASLSGTATKTDFVELPSQMFEEWMWEPSILKRVSRHYKTGEPLPDDLIEKKIALRQFGAASFVRGQGLYSLLSLRYFAKGEKKDTSQIRQDLYHEYVSEVRFEPDAHFQASFGHLTNYGAKYYSYLWSKVFALDLFEMIKEEGLLSPGVGQKLVREVLGQGGAQDPAQLLCAFLGREPRQDAFLKSLGLM